MRTLRIVVAAACLIAMPSAHAEEKFQKSPLTRAPADLVIPTTPYSPPRVDREWSLDRCAERQSDSQSPKAPTRGQNINASVCLGYRAPWTFFK